MVALQKGPAKDKHVMHLSRSLWFFTTFYDINLQPEHILRVSNYRADQLSRNYMLIFFNSNPQDSQLGIGKTRKGEIGNGKREMRKWVEM